MVRSRGPREIPWARTPPSPPRGRSTGLASPWPRVGGQPHERATEPGQSDSGDQQPLVAEIRAHGPRVLHAACRLTACSPTAIALGRPAGFAPAQIHIADRARGVPATDRSAQDCAALEQPPGAGVDPWHTRPLDGHRDRLLLQLRQEPMLGEAPTRDPGQGMGRPIFPALFARAGPPVPKSGVDDALAPAAEVRAIVTRPPCFPLRGGHKPMVRGTRRGRARMTRSRSWPRWKATDLCGDDPEEELDLSSRRLICTNLFRGSPPLLSGHRTQRELPGAQAGRKHGACFQDATCSLWALGPRDLRKVCAGPASGGEAKHTGSRGKNHRPRPKGLGPAPVCV